MSQRDLSQTSCLLMLIKLNGPYFTLSQKDRPQILPQTLPNLITKVLGVFIDENLSWKQHIEILSSKISKSIGILYKSKDVLSKQCLKQLYFSFIHGYGSYANVAWTSTSKSKLERLYRCQKHAARVIYDKDRYTHASLLLNDMKAF